MSAKNKVKIGIDAHLNNYSVCLIGEDGNPKPVQKFNEVGLLKWVAKQCVEGVEVYTCYEAGPMGFELHRKLESLGVKNVVVQPQNWDERGKGQKTDAMDAKALANRLDRYVAGNKESFATVRIASKEEQIKRDLSRHRESLKEQTKRIAAKGGSLLRYHGYLTDNGWWKKNAWEKFEQDLVIGIIKILKNYREQILLLESQEKAVIEELESSEGAGGIKGLGNLSAESLT